MLFRSYRRSSTERAVKLICFERASSLLPIGAISAPLPRQPISSTDYQQVATSSAGAIAWLELLCSIADRPAHDPFIKLWIGEKSSMLWDMPKHYSDI